jgi:hypothetical protein
VPESCKSLPLEMVFPDWIRKERINGMVLLFTQTRENSASIKKEIRHSD